MKNRQRKKNFKKFERKCSAQILNASAITYKSAAAYFELGRFITVGNGEKCVEIRPYL